VRVVIADDHTLVRAGIRRLLESFEGVSVVAEAGSGAETLEVTSLHRPDLVLLDLSMPDRNGLDVTSDISRLLPGTLVVIMSMYADLGRVREALDRGARGFVVKEAAVAELELALRAAMDGQTFLSPQVSGRMVDSLLGRPGERGVESLSPRQRQILKRLGQGESTKEIAAELGISAKTVETHRARMMETLRCRRAADLLRVAIQHTDALA
jgi:DNA-binding NarL/FixJ family response regulator